MSCNEFDQIVYVRAKKSTNKLCLMTLKIDEKFEGKVISASKNDIRNLVNFHQNTGKSQNWNFDGILLSKVENV